jgi:hypothetical protein
MSNYPPSIEGLLDLAWRTGVDVRPTLFRVLTDLYLQSRSHTAAEETQFVELALRLADSVDDATRKIVATRLSAYRAAPKAVLDRLRDLGAVPEPSPAITGDIGETFFAADSAQRHFMIRSLDVGAPSGASRCTAPATEACRRIEAAALDRNLSEVSQLIERALALPRGIAERITQDNSGEPLVVVAKALGMERAALERILLIMNPVIGRSVERVYALANLFDEIDRSAADLMMEVWRGASARRRPAYRPALWNDDARSARSFATADRRPSVRRSEVSHPLRQSGR